MTIHFKSSSVEPNLTGGHVVSSEARISLSCGQEGKRIKACGNFIKKCNNHSCRDALLQKQREQTITPTAMGSQTTYVHITAQCITE